MPRSNRPRGRRGFGGDDKPDISRALLGTRHTEQKHDGEWNVQPQTAVGSTKSYVCPGCGLEIGIGVGHTVAWRADGIMGESSDLAARRHWHLHCWRTKS